MEIKQKRKNKQQLSLTSTARFLNKYDEQGNNRNNVMISRENEWEHMLTTAAVVNIIDGDIVVRWCQIL